MQWSFGNTGSLNYVNLTNVDQSLYALSKKSHVLISPLISSEKSLKYWEAVMLTMDTHNKILIFT